MIFDLLHVRIRIKLLGLVLLPVVGGGVLSGLVVAQQARLLERMQHLRTASSLSVSVGNLVHALQSESTGTALFLGSQGQHGEALASAREATNRERLALEAALSGTAPELGALFPAPVKEGIRLRDLRRRADRRTAPMELIDGYAREVDALLQVQNRLISPAAGTPLESRFQAFGTLARAKESTGLEGALLSCVFAQGALDVPTQERFLALLDTQRAQGEAFLSAATESTKLELRKAMEGPFAADLQRLRDLVQTGRVTQESEAWTRVAAAELQALKGVQDRMSQDLLTDALALERGARLKGWLLSAGFGVFGLVVLLWTWRATVLITEPLQALADGMARMENGDLRIQLPVHSYDETGRMTEAFNAMSAHLRELAWALQGHAARVTNGAEGLSNSAEQVSNATQQLARSSRTQREASEEVAHTVAQLQVTLVQVRASVDAMIEGGREAGIQVRDTGLRARRLLALLKEVAQRGETSLQPALREGASQVEAMAQAMAHVDEALGAIESVGEEIHKVAEVQSALSLDVNRRMEVSQAATGEVQLAAAQLANTTPEVVLTARDLVRVAQSLKSSAAAFQVE